MHEHVNIHILLSTVIDVGQELLNTLMKVVKWIIDHWYVLLIVGTVIGTLIVRINRV